ncbi:phosphoglycerate dehydrogenase [Xylanivirga thermophila]|uniref:phosphoglycerate dehydrogenase n=1 Tax=Xylanivirga thermophila TaxID=2496273 RepID=UPI00101B6D06|nr:phosphoglycerate dehydrogenase [Xylanivirga thermophila]
MKVLVAEKIAQSGIDLLKDQFDVDIKTDLTPDSLLECIGDYDAIIVRSATKVTKEVLDRGVNLKVVGRAGNGVDNIDLEAATLKGIIVVNTPTSNNISTAEHTIALMLALARKIPQANMSLKENRWDRGKYKGTELFGKTVAVMGLGRIGSIVATRLRAFGMKVIGYDPYINDERFEKIGVEKVTKVEEIMKRADFITLHLPKTDQTLGIIGKEELDMAKPNLMIVNCARGGLVDEEGLFDALKEKKIAGAAMDVYKTEPKDGSFDHPFLQLDNIVLTPHLGASTMEAQENVGIAIAEQVSQALKGNIVSAVNLSGLRVHDMDILSPYLKMAEILGKLYYAIDDEPIKKVEITYSGDIIEQETKLITLSYLSGLLNGIVEERVNFVNAEFIVKNMGIEVVEGVTRKLEHYTNLVSLKIYTKKGCTTFAGTIFGKEEIRIVNFFGYDVDIVPTPHILVIKNIDKPGVIGQIGTIIGLSGINIASMKVSRIKGNEEALMILNVDNALSKENIKMMENVDGILKVCQINL